MKRERKNELAKKLVYWSNEIMGARKSSGSTGPGIITYADIADLLVLLNNGSTLSTETKKNSQG